MNLCLFLIRVDGLPGLVPEHVAITGNHSLASGDDLEPLIKQMWTLCEETEVPGGNPRTHRSGSWCVTADGLVSHSELLKCKQLFNTSE